MKRIFTIITASMLAFATLQAQELNIYASGLTAGAVDNTNLEVNISYTLNAPATSLAVILQKGSDTPVELAITGAANLTKGTHSDVAVDLNDVPSGTYSWSIKAEGAATASSPVKLSDDSAPFQFYFPSGVTVDNSFESPYFGRIYVAEGDGGQCSGGGRLTEDGIYILDATLESVGSQAYAGNINWSADGTYAEGVRSPGRLSVDASGNIFIADNSTTNSGVYVMDPAAPGNNFTAVFALDNRDATGLVTANSNITHGRIPALYVEGSGDNTVLYTIDRNCLPTGAVEHVYLKSGYVYKYVIGNWATSYALLPEIIYDNSTDKLVNDAMSLFPDGRGGFWICQNRAADAANMPSILHINAAGVEDYNSVSGGLGLGNTNASTRGGMAINPAGTLLAIGNNRYVRTYTISYDAGTGVPSLSQITENAINIAGLNIDNIAFDVADNIYVVSASTERFYAYALPKASNAFTTPAPAASTLEVINKGTGISDQVAAKTPKSVQYFDLTGKPVAGNTKGFVIKKTIYEDGSIENSKEIK